QVYLAGTTMQIERGTISFTDPTRIPPDLDLQHTTRSAGDDITLSLSGTPDQLTVDVQNTTEPTMGDEEIYQRLLGGTGGVNGGQAAALLSSELLGSTGRAVGLDSLRVERGFSQATVRADPGQLATEADPSTRLTLSKRVRPDVEVTLSQSLRNSGDLSAIVAYRPRRNIELRGVSLGSGDRLMDVRHEITFGGGGTTVPADEPDLRVSAIAISGEPGEPEAALMRLLGLTEGDRFNFFDWQRDIDRLRHHYWDAGYLEARVRATRDEDDAAGTVSLEYEVTRGPLATVEFAGYLAPDSLRDELEEAWTRTIFDQFLLGDFESRVARHLLADDIVGSTVTAAVVTETPARKVIRVEVAPGATVSRRELRFSGNQAVPSSRLETAVERAGLGAEAWLEPGTIADAVQAFYRSTGFLTATVTAADAPRVEDGVGVLPITVVEGPRFVLGAVALQGVDAAREGLVRDAAGLKAGDQYDAAGLEAGARRIERAYRSRGFNAVRVDVRSAIDEAAGTVAVRYAVEEGLQQVLREVTTSGATRTREGVIAGALKLHPGDPVNLAEWGQARKRLYDTNVFRQVDIEAQPLTPDADTAPGVEPVRAVVTVVEYPTWRFRYGLQFNDERVDESDGVTTRAQSLGITGDLQNQNLLGRAIGAGISGRYERDRWTARTFVQTPTFIGLPASTTLYGEVSSEELRVDDLVQFVTDKRTIATEQRWQRGRGLQVSYGYRFERSRTFDPAPAPDDPFPLDITVNIARVNAAFLADRRNDPFNPTGGWFFSTSRDQAAEALGSDYRKAKLSVQEYYFRKLGPVVLASRAGFGGSFWADETLLPQERFYTGGGTTVRGYGENALGPRDFLGQASGGKALILLNQEVRFPIAWWFHGVGFVDGGNVFPENADASLGDLKWGYGLGLRVDTPFALVRIDFGIPGSELDVGNARRANAWSSGRWYFGIGHIF
ncbi:MAG: translocation/assembly module TamB domain-containing protein, partial [Vicinamibacterales bacterium]